MICGSVSLNQFACLRTKTRVARRISAFACSTVNSPLRTRTHSRYPIADIVGSEAAPAIIECAAQVSRGEIADRAELAGLEAELESCGMADGNRAFNLTWHDWLNLKSLVSVSRAIADAALARNDSRGAHYRSDFPLTGPLEQSAFTSIRDGRLTMKPVRFTRVRPGESLLKDAA